MKSHILSYTVITLLCGCQASWNSASRSTENRIYMAAKSGNFQIEKLSMGGFEFVKDGFAFTIQTDPGSCFPTHAQTAEFDPTVNLVYSSSQKQIPLPQIDKWNDLYSTVSVASGSSSPSLQSTIFAGDGISETAYSKHFERFFSDIRSFERHISETEQGAAANP